MDEQEIRKRMVSIAARMYSRDFISGLAGNLSVRLPSGKLLVSPAGVPKGSLHFEQLLVIDYEADFTASSSGLKPTSELPMHREIYR